MGITLTADHVIVGVDVGKTSHHAHLLGHGLARLGRRRLTNTPTACGELLDWASGYGSPVLVVDQKASYAAMLRYAADQRGVPVLYVTGLQARRAADLTPGRAKTDRIDAEVIATFAYTHHRSLPVLAPAEELNTQLRLLLGRDEDLRCDFNRHINRIRDLLTGYAPTLEVGLGRRVVALGVLAVLARWGNPVVLAKAQTRTITATIAAHNPRLAARVAAQIRAAAKATPDSPGIETAGALISDLAAAAMEIAEQRARIGEQLTALAQQHDDYELLCTIPGMGPKTAVQFVAEIGDINRFPTAGHLASYAGLAPVNRQSGTGLNTVAKDRAGNHRLKNALFLSAFVAARHEPRAVAHYNAQRDRGKHHNAAVIAVARKRCDLIWAILTNRTPYQKPSPSTLQT